MSGILDLLTSGVGQQLIGGISNQTNTSSDNTAKVLQMALPMMIGAMNKNANSGGAAGLNAALEDGRHDGSILDNIGSLLGGSQAQNVQNDGAGILGHVFGNGQNNIEQAVSKSSGVDVGSVANILKMAAPFLMGFLGKQKRSNGVGADGLGGLLGGMLGGGSAATQNQSMVERLLDSDGDGSVIDDVVGMLAGGGNQSKGGGLLGGLFGK